MFAHYDNSGSRSWSPQQREAKRRELALKEHQDGKLSEYDAAIMADVKAEQTRRGEKYKPL